MNIQVGRLITLAVLVLSSLSLSAANVAQTTPTPTPTRTPSATATLTSTATATKTALTVAPSSTPTSTHTSTLASTATQTTSAVALSNTPTPTHTATPTNTATRTNTSASSTSTSTITPSRTPTFTTTSTPTLLTTPNGFIPPLSTPNPLRVAPPAQPNRAPLAPNALSAVSGSVRGDWQFDGNLNDSSGNGNNGIDYPPPNSASYTQGISGSGLVRDGNLLPIQLINNTNSLIMTDKISIEAWVKSSDYGGGFRHIIDNTDGYALSILNGGVAMLGPGFWWTPNVPQLSLNQWHYVVGTYDIATGYQALYVDGQLVIDRYIPDGIPAGSGQIAIGGWGGGGQGAPYLFNGVIDNLRVTNGALTAAEIAANYAALTTPTPTVTPTFTSTPTPTSTPSPTPAQTGYTISGRITDVLNRPIAGVAISGFGITTDVNGSYSITVSPGVYQIIPSKAGFTFSPKSRSVTVPPSAQNQDFIGDDRLPIVFVHGYNGFKDGQVDPDDYFVDMDGALIREGYHIERANLLSSKSFTPLAENNVDNLIVAINRAKDATGQQKVILITHSMGGIVSRAYIESYKYRGDVAAVFTMGSPHEGLPLDLANLVYNLPLDVNKTCKEQPFLCEITPVGMTFFNRAHQFQRDVRYYLINGDLQDKSRSEPAGYFLTSLINSRSDGLVTVESGTALNLNSDGRIVHRWTSLDEYHSVSMGGPRDYIVWQENPPQKTASRTYLECLKPLLVDRVSVACGSPVGIASLISGVRLAKIINPTFDKPSQNATSALAPHTPFEYGTASAGQTVTRTVSVEGGATTFGARWQTNGLTLTLVDPNGQVIDPIYAANNPTVVDHKADSTTSVYVLPNAIGGRWQMVIRADNNVPTGVGGYMTLAVFNNSNLQLTGETDRAWYAPGATATIKASLSGSPANATITARIIRSDGIVDVVTLAPRGRGEYQGRYVVPNVPGYAEVRLFATGTTTNSTPFERGASVLFQISPTFASLNGIYRDTPQPNATPPYQSLTVSVGVNSSVNRRVTLSADLIDANGKVVAHSNATQELVVGANTIDLRFSGADIYASQENGPYKLTNVLLTDTQEAALVIAEAENVYRTARYQWRDFAPVSPPVTNPAPLNSFVVLGQEGVWLKEKVVVHSGNVGANTASVGPHLDDRAEVIIGAQVRFLNSSSLVLGDSLVIREKAQVYDVYYNEIRGNGTMQGRRYTPLALPLVNQPPAIPTFTAGTQRVDVREGGTLTLAAGSYGDLRVRSKATITFTGGVYTFKSWDIGEEVKLYFTAPSEIRIAENLDTNAKTYLGPKPGVAGLTAKEIRIIVLGQNGRNGNPNAEPRAAKFGERNKVIANVYTPNGTLWLKEKTEATGAFIAKWVVVGEEVELRLVSGW